MRLSRPISPDVPVVKELLKVLRGCDFLLSTVAWPFGVYVRSAAIRWFLFIVVHAVIYWLASGRELIGYSVDPEGAKWLLAFAWLGTVAIGRAWVRNEKRRSDIVHKLVEEALPDRYPDLRLVAVVSALQMFVIFPLLFWRLSLGEDNQLFSAASENQVWDWVLFTVGAVQSQVPFFGSSDEFMSVFATGITGTEGAVQELIPGVNVTSESVVAVLKGTFDVILIQAFIRIAVIRRAFQEVLTEEALRNGHEPATRLGCRAVKPLIRQLKNTDEMVQISAARALGEIGDRRAVRELTVVLNSGAKWPVRGAAAAALGQIGDSQVVPALMHYLLDDEGTDSACLRNTVARSLGQLDDSRAVGPLLDRLNRYRDDITCRLDEAKTVLFGGAANSPQFEIDYEQDLTDPTSGKKVYGPDGVQVTFRTSLSGRVVDSGTDVDDETKWPYIEIQTEDQRFQCVFLRIHDLQPMDSQSGPQTGLKVQAAYEFVRNGIKRFYSDDQVVVALGRIGDPQASPRLVELIREADSLPGIKWLGEEQAEAFREHIVLALQRIGDPTAAEGLLSVLDGDFSESLKQQAAVALGQLFEPANSQDPETWTGDRVKEINARYEEWLNGEPSSNAKAIRERISNLRFRLDRGVDEMNNHLRVVTSSLHDPKPPFSIRIGHERMSVDEFIDGHTLRVQRGAGGLPRSHTAGGDVFVVSSNQWGHSSTRKPARKSAGVLRSLAALLLVGVLGVLGAHQVLYGNGSDYAGSDFGNGVALTILDVHQALGGVLPSGTAVDSTMFLSVLYGVPAILLLLVLIVGRGGRGSRPSNRPGPSSESPGKEPVIEPKVEMAIEVADEPVFEPAIEVADEPVIEVADEPVFEPAIEVTDEPVIEVADEPVFEPAIEMADEPVLEAAIEVADEPVFEPAIEVTDVPVFEPAIEVADESVIEVTDEPVLEPKIELAEGVLLDEPVESSDDLDAFLDIIGEDLLSGGSDDDDSD